VLDDCGVCGGFNKDKGCDGVCFSGKLMDARGGCCKASDRGCNGMCFSCACDVCAPPPPPPSQCSAPAPAPVQQCSAPAPAPACSTCAAGRAAPQQQRPVQYAQQAQQQRTQQQTQQRGNGPWWSG
jgi:hypothetical protein